MRRNKTFAVVLLCLASIVLLLEGSLMLLSSLGPFFPNPRIEATLNANWWLSALAICFLFKKKMPTFVLGWTFLLQSIYLSWSGTDERSATLLLYQNSLPLAFTVLMHAAGSLSRLNSS